MRGLCDDFCFGILDIMLPASLGRKRRKRFNIEHLMSSSQGKLKKSVTSECSAAEANQKDARLPKVKSTGNSTEMKRQFRATRLTVYLNAVLSGLSIFLAAWENEFTAQSNYEETWLADMTRGLVLTLSGIQLFLIRQYYMFGLRTQVACGRVDDHTSLCEDPACRLLALEALMTCLCTPPLVFLRFSLHQPGFSSSVSLGDILIGFTCLRAYQLVYVLYWCNMEVRELFFYDIENVASAPIYRLKAILFDRPYQTIALLYIAFLILIGPVVRAAERTAPGAQSNTLFDNVWNMAVTQATVGYGDIVPRTNIGRTISICAALAGFLTNTLMQTVALQKVRMSVRELQFIAAMKKKNTIPVHVCAGLLQRWWRLVLARKRFNPQRFDLLLKYMNCVWTFRLLVRRKVSHDYLEFHQLLDNTHRRTSLRFGNLKKRVQALKFCAKSLAHFSTDHSTIVSKLLWMKSRYKRMLDYKERPVRRRLNKMKSTLLTSLQKKQASDGAYKRMLAFRFGHRSSTEKWGDSPLLPSGDVTPTTEAGSWFLPGK